jgi:hypothetical protein
MKFYLTIIRKILLVTQCFVLIRTNIGAIFLLTPFFKKLFNSSLLWDVFIINSVEQLHTLPKTQSEIDISPFLKIQKPSILYYIVKDRGFQIVFLEMGLYRSRIEFLVMFEVVQHCL